MTKHIELKAVNPGTALGTGRLALPPRVIEGRLCLQGGAAAIEAMLAADSEALWQASALEMIDTLFAEELTLRENRRVKMALRIAKLTFSTLKRLAGSPPRSA